MTDRKHKSGGQATAAARLARMRAKREADGLVRVDVTVPAERKDDIREVARQMREEPQACSTDRAE